MAEFSEALLWSILRASVLLTATFVLVALLLQRLKVHSANLHSAAWFIVLLQGTMLCPWNVNWAVYRVLPEAAGDSGSVSVVEFREVPIDETSSLTDPGMKRESAQLISSAIRFVQDDLSAAQVIVGAWILGVLSAAGYLVYSYVKFCMLLEPVTSDSRSHRAEERDWQIDCDMLCRQTAVSRSVQVRVTDNVGPAVCRLPAGCFLLIPAGHRECLTVSQREMVLRHELAHLRRRDLWTIAACSLIACLQWFNPLAWRAVRNIAECSEWACDEYVRRSCRHSPADYVRLLLQLSTESRRIPLLVPSATGHSLVRRSQRLLTPMFTEDHPMKKLTLLSTAAVLAAFGAVNVRLTAQDAEAVAAADEKPAAVQNAAGRTAAAEKPETSTDVEAPATPDTVAAPDTVTTKAATTDGSPKATTEVRGVLIRTAPVSLLSMDPGDPAGSGAVMLTADSLRLDIDSLPRRRGTREAVIDLQYIFGKLPEFRAQREELQKQLRNHEAACRAESNVLRSLSDKRIGASPEERESLEREIVERKAKFDAELEAFRRQMTRQEAKNYATSYRRIRDVIAVHARENDIQIVRRAGLGHDQRDRLESDDPKVILQAMNEQVLYVADEGIDITEAVLQRLLSDREPTH
ncbi:MAG: OmpH family outer membrane protein [Planctomycetaceae bacterium]|nr:OmpH family outer membrane protein [Planctomycetaceae bacterium]